MVFGLSKKQWVLLIVAALVVLFLPIFILGLAAVLLALFYPGIKRQNRFYLGLTGVLLMVLSWIIGTGVMGRMF